MLRNIIAVLVIALCTERPVMAQSMDEQLLALERMAYLETSDSVRNTILFQKQDLYVRYNLFDESVLKETKRIDHRLLNSQERFRYLWNSSVIAFLNEDYSYSKFYLRNYLEATSDTSVQVALLKLAITAKDDPGMIEHQVSELAKMDSTLSMLICFASSFDYTARYKTLYSVMSAMIPGSGTMIQGELMKGASSLLVNSAMVYGITALITQGLYVNAAAWGLGLGLKFYSGNIKLTRVIHEQKEAEAQNLLTNECKEVFTKSLERYPLSFK